MKTRFPLAGDRVRLRLDAARRVALVPQDVPRLLSRVGTIVAAETFGGPFVTPKVVVSVKWDAPDDLPTLAARFLVTHADPKLAPEGVPGGYRLV